MVSPYNPRIIIMITTYSKKLETMMKNFYESLSEKDKRGYAAIESLKFEYGGKNTYKMY